jgi:hypothetical protein
MSIATKTISELKDLSFFVPSYQRGYRWTKNEVIALLDDVNEFRSESGQRYCLQPLLVKKRDDGSYEVVDGQQRLTTVYIFMKVAEQEIRSATPPFQMEYQTRSGSKEFLMSLSDDKKLDNDKYIDFSYMADAYKTMNKWLDNQPDKSVAIQELNTKFRSKVFFIWYEVLPEVDPITMFTKVNLGKIPLTNSELIKALLLNRDNYQIDNNEVIHRRQTEMSVAWDKIEQRLQNDSFWYFLNANDRSGTRIDLLFELLARDRHSKLPTAIDESQKYYTFLVFSALLATAENKEHFVKELWSEVEKLFAEFDDWYSDLDKYHIIGYLITMGVSIEEIFAITRGKRKSLVTKELLRKAELTLSGGYDDLGELTSGVSRDKEKIRKVLLLFNIATLVCKGEKQYRFPFDIFKGETGERMKWDIEHIHATADETDDPDDYLGNLTLLDARTNRSYQNAPFVEKRRIIIDRESKGLFVPLCTMNVFLKVYSDDLSNMEKWSDSDKEHYVQAIETTLATFLQGGVLNE